MKKVLELMTAQKEQQNPGHEIGRFLLQHSNNPVYLVSQLEAYLEAIKVDIEQTRSDYAVFARALTGNGEWKVDCPHCSQFVQIQKSEPVVCPKCGNEDIECSPNE